MTMDETSLNQALERFLAVLRGVQMLRHPGGPPTVTSVPHEHYWRVYINNAKVYCFVIRTHYAHWQPGDILAPPVFGISHPEDRVGSIFGDSWPNPPPTSYFTNFCGPEHVGESAYTSHPNRYLAAFAPTVPSQTTQRKPTGLPAPRNPSPKRPPGNRKPPALHAFDHMLLHARLKADCPNGEDEISWLDEID
jgi:hypothetical protein